MFNIGDLVKQKNGNGYPMTITFIGDNEAICSWTDAQGTECISVYSLDTLVKANEDNNSINIMTCEEIKSKGWCGQYCEKARTYCPEGIKARFPYAEEEKNNDDMNFRKGDWSNW